MPCWLAYLGGSPASCRVNPSSIFTSSRLANANQTPVNSPATAASELRYCLANSLGVAVTAYRPCLWCLEPPERRADLGGERAEIGTPAQSPATRHVDEHLQGNASCEGECA